MTGGYYTTTRSETFTVTHAEHIAAKVATDLKRMQRFYPRQWIDDDDIDYYEREVVILLKGNYLLSVSYGLVRDQRWIVALRYMARYGGVLVPDNDPGRVPRNAKVDSECRFRSVLSGNGKWHGLNEVQKKRVYADGKIPFVRTAGGDYAGSWREDKVYSAGGRGVLRYTVS